MRKRDKLYTANKWNRPLFANVDRENQNIFDGEYNSSMQIGIPINTGYNPQVNIPDKININGIIQQNAYNDYMNSSGNNWFGISKKNNPFSKQNVGTTMKGIGAGAAVAAGAVNTGDPRGLYDTLDPVYHLAGGRESGAGNALSDTGVGLFNAGAQSGNGWLMLAGAGAKILGGLTNAAFGLKTDKDRLNRINQNIADFNGSFGASSLDDIKGFGALASPKGIYKGGWFSGGKAKRKNEELTNSFNNALSFAQRGQTNTVDNMWREKLHDEFADWYAFGGSLGTPMYSNTGMGAIDYGFMSDYLTAKNRQAENKNTASNPFAGVANNFFPDGGSIHIKHPGRLTRLKERTGKTEAELWAEGKPEVRKMITFARNARKWKKAYGGYIEAANNLFALGGPDDPPVGTTIYRDVYDPNNSQAGTIRTKEFIPMQSKAVEPWEPVANINKDYVPQHGGMYGAIPQGMSKEDGEYYQKVLHDYDDYPITTYSYGYKKGAYQPYKEDYGLMNVHNYPNGALGYDIRDAQGTTQYIPTKDGRWFRMTQSAGEMGEPVGEYIDALPEFDFNKYTLKSTDGENYIGNPNLHAFGGDKKSDENLENLMFYLSQKEKYPNGRKKTEAEKFLNYRLGVPERKTAPWFEETPTYMPESPSEHLDRVLDTTSKIVKGIGKETKKKVSKGEPYIPHVKFAFGGDKDNALPGYGGGSFSGAGQGNGFVVEKNTYKEAKNFNDAYDKAVKEGRQYFMFQGKKYNTKKEENPIREFNNRWVGERRVPNEKRSGYGVDYGPIGGPLANLPVVRDTYTGTPDRPPQLEYNPDAYDTFYHRFTMPTRSSERHKIVPGRPVRWEGDKLVYAFGGDMQTNSADFSTGLTHISAGGSHEESPYDGVQLGVDSEGKPNLVEEGEVIFNDYVFSDRIPIDDETKKKFHFPKKRDITYAEAAKKLEKEISERPNDPISKASFNAQMQQLEEQQERQKQEMEAARAREAFEALSPEEQAGIMRYAQQQEQAAQEQAMQQEAMAQQAQMQQPSPEEIAMAEQQQMISQEEMAYGGNLYPDGGAMNYLKGKYPQMNIDSLRKIATILEKRVADRLTDKRTRKLTRNATEKDYSRAFSEYDSLNSNRRFNNWVKAGLSRDVAFDISYAKPPKSWGQGELDKWNAKRAELTREPERRTVYKNPLNGKTFNTKAEADADVKAYKEAQRQQAASSKASKPAHQTFEDSRGWKHSTQEAAEAANARYAKQNQQNSTGSYVDDRGWKHSTQQAAEAANKRYAQQAQSAQSSGQAPQKDIAKDSATNTASKSAQSVASSQRAASRQSSKNMGVWKEGVSNQWDTYTRPGLDAYLSDLEERYNNAASEEEREAIRSAAINEFNNLQQSYYDYVLPGIGNTPTGYDENVEAHQRMFENMKGNTGFWGVGNDGSITNRIENDIDMPTGHHTTDTPAGHGIDGYNGPRTSIRNFGSTEYGGDDYYAPYVERFNNLGLTYSPMQKWRYGDDLGKSLYGLSMGEVYPEDATNFGDYNPDYEEEDTFEVVDENGNPTGISASSAEAVSGVPGTTALTNTNPVPKHKAEWMRYAGLFGPAVGLGMQMAGIGKPDYSGLDAAVNGSGNAYLANWAPIGNYLRYEPMDIWFEQNRLNANARATDRAILNSGSNQGAKAAALLASGYNNQVASGDLYRKAREYNDAQKYQIAGFNRGTDQFNAEAYNRNSQFNADALNRVRQFNRSLAMQAANQKLASDAGWYNGIYGNVAGLFRGLSELGRENAQYNWLSDLAADGVFGNLGTSYTGQRYIEDKNKKNNAAKGGKLKKKGLTF